LAGIFRRYLLKIGYYKMPGDISIRYGVQPCGSETAKGSVVMLGGRKEFIEKHAETIDELNRRNFDVYTIDWRGQGLSSRLLQNRHKGHVEKFDDYIADLACFMNDIVEPAAASPVIILAHSMGGHITLRFLHDFPDAVKKAVLTSPMVDILAPNFPKWLIRFAADLAFKTGFGDAYSAGSGDYSAAGINFEGNPLTSDPIRFMDEHRAIAGNPDLAIGGVTYGWLKAAFDSIEILADPEYAGRIETPVLILSAERDRIVSQTAQKEICRAMKRGVFASIPGAYHEILKEKDEIREVFWSEFDRFIS
jgi:lysophospholipase